MSEDNASQFPCYGNMLHELIVIKSQETCDKEQTRKYWAATQVLCQTCFKIFDVTDIERMHVE